MTAGTMAPEQLFGCDVYDGNGNKIGSVDGVWVDDSTQALKFIAVKTGMIFGKDHLIPASNLQTDGGTITIPYTKEQVDNAPSFDTDYELSPDDEAQIYSYYGMDRSTATSPTGLAEGTTGDTTIGTTDYGAADTNLTTAQDQVTLSKEEVQVGKREVEAGNVRLRKIVNTEHEEVPVELQREQVSIERVGADSTDVPNTAFQEQEIEVPVMREEPVVSKEARATGGVRLNKDVQTETRTVGADVQSEDVEIEGDGVDTDTVTRSDTSY